MNAVEIIDEIMHLPPGEQARVIRYVRSLETDGKLTPRELSAAAGDLAEENDPARVEVIREQIATGFYSSSA